MTPEERAKELVEKFSKPLSSYSMSKKHRYEYATQCAIICVEEILPLAKGCDFGISGIIAKDEGLMTNQEYWQQVLNQLK